MNRKQLIVLWVGMAAFAAVAFFRQPDPTTNIDAATGRVYTVAPDYRGQLIELGTVAIVTAVAVLSLGAYLKRS